MTEPRRWRLAASAFNWTPEVIRAERTAADIAVGIVADGLASVIEVEAGQVWRTFPTPTDAEADRLRGLLEPVGGAVSIVGVSIDDWATPRRRRDDDERLAFLLPQLRAAHRLGAAGVRLPIGQAGEPLLRRLQPTLHELDLVLYEELQGQQTPRSQSAAPALDTIARLDDPHVRALVDTSMFMPALPVTYLERLREEGVPGEFVDRLAAQWRDPATADAVLDMLRQEAVPPQAHTLFMDLVVRFGRSEVAELRDMLPLVGAFHLKFWDLADIDGRVSGPIGELGRLLEGSDFTGTLCSEWGGHAWLDADPTDMTRRHLALVRSALGSAY
ncbi:hypothetical protein [Salinactinospora qingdaonensis]|uniref:Restriction endonuclease subunit R n=1 Tax=Salinactinospora qingdaonensis TaxID=702744 RepID=A0ABP7G6M5_9ACTN